jgi:cephalosporin hydroxylase
MEKRAIMTPYKQFKSECEKEINMQNNPLLWQKTYNWMFSDELKKYSYHFEWMGRPIIQYPQDIVQFQEIVWQTKPDLIIETGIAHGGSLVLSASMLSLLPPAERQRMVLGIDIDIREHNREAIETHPMAGRIKMIEGSSIDLNVAAQVKDYAKNFNSIMVCLDSNHTHEHVLEELKIYAELVSVGNYCIVWDTIIEDMPQGSFPERPWDKGRNPKTAVWEFLKENDDFIIDKDIQNKLLITVAPDGYLKRIGK